MSVGVDGLGVQGGMWVDELYVCTTWLLLLEEGVSVQQHCFFKDASYLEVSFCVISVWQRHSFFFTRFGSIRKSLQRKRDK